MIDPKNLPETTILDESTKLDEPLMLAVTKQFGISDVDAATEALETLCNMAWDDDMDCSRISEAEERVLVILKQHTVLVEALEVMVLDIEAGHKLTKRFESFLIAKQALKSLQKEET